MPWGLIGPHFVLARHCALKVSYDFKWSLLHSVRDQNSQRDRAVQPDGIIKCLLTLPHLCSALCIWQLTARVGSSKSAAYIHLNIKLNVYVWIVCCLRAQIVHWCAFELQYLQTDELKTSSISLNGNQWSLNQLVFKCSFLFLSLFYLLCHYLCFYLYNFKYIWGIY